MMKEGIINLSISLRLYCTFAMFPTRDPRGLPELCSRDPGHHYSQADTPWPCLGPEEEWERHSPFLLQKNKTFSIALRRGCRAAWMTADVPHFIPCFATPLHLRRTLGLSTRPHRQRISSALHFPPQGQFPKQLNSTAHAYCLACVYALALIG